ncbi:bifunctional helix-turn-helix transcriptional regulator/GNAT family N-acetyltransferase [Chondrinema litorale]|uniref:bifunctional helix-turn-helix transcriptional regulator/GNAT family N-acetyltransferase n=1 Tax=Chondrinema litorale TaxID=2994555 RepID=UPI0025439ADC|nr:bifunctional helix-turn-helix transcriptional regulator/GNAT family N-acetyltransferase [Chondrinema litorale]UZR94727.1 bifunctional helix-turn-helix transcriptional regulator/GNAT family N-acetyltransferase [Chondrinema litorale]
MDFFNQVGKIAIGSRLRILTEKITEDAGKIYNLYGVDMQPKWFPVYYALSNCEAKSVTVIAKEIGHSHPSVSKIVREMAKAGVVQEKKDKDDGRRNVVELSATGKEVSEKIQDQYTDLNNAINDLSSQALNDLWEAIGEWEYLLEQKNLYRRVLEQKKQRESEKIQIVEYSPKYQAAFKQLNVEWISTYFQLEDADYKALDNPENYILDHGGYIFVALYDDVPLGVCALIKMDDPEYDYELAKMAVSPKAQGKGLGWLLGNAVLNKAKELGASSVFLDSNTILKPAINLYHKLGFKKVPGRPTPYDRCNIQMAVNLV